MSKINEEIRGLEREIKGIKNQIETDKKLREDIIQGRRTIYDVYPHFDSHETSVDWLDKKLCITSHDLWMRKCQLSDLYHQREWYECEYGLFRQSDIERIINNGNYIIGIRL